MNSQTATIQKGKILEFKPKKKNGNSRIVGGNGCNTAVDPIHSLEDIERAKQYFLTKPKTYRSQNIRNYMLFIVGMNFGRRISDILNLKIKDVINKDGSSKEYVIFREGKTNKISLKVYIHPNVHEAITLYLASKNNNYKMTDYLFQSHKVKTKPIGRHAVWDILKKMSNDLNLSENIGAHSMRKTKGYQYIEKNNESAKSLGTVAKAYSHRSIKDTLRYCGFDNELMKDFYLNNGL